MMSDSQFEFTGKYDGDEASYKSDDDNSKLKNEENKNLSGDDFFVEKSEVKKDSPRINGSAKKRDDIYLDNEKENLKNDSEHLSDDDRDYNKKDSARSTGSRKDSARSTGSKRNSAQSTGSRKDSARSTGSKKSSTGNDPDKNLSDDDFFGDKKDSARSTGSRKDSARNTGSRKDSARSTGSIKNSARSTGSKGDHAQSNGNDRVRNSSYSDEEDNKSSERSTKNDRHKNSNSGSEKKKIHYTSDTEYSDRENKKETLQNNEKNGNYSDDQFSDEEMDTRSYKSNKVQDSSSEGGESVRYENKKNKNSGRRSDGYSDNDSSEKSSDDEEEEEDRKAFSSAKETKKSNNQKQNDDRATSQPARTKPPMHNGKGGAGYGKNRQRGGGRGGRGRGRSVDKVNGGGNGQFSEDRSVIVNRVLSANRNKSKALHNVIFELQQHIENLSTENKDLKRAARLQDRELRRLDSAESELPMLMKKHSEELRTVQEKFKRQKESADKARENLKRRDDELGKTRDKLRKYQNMVKDRNLNEKNNLSKKVEELEGQVQQKNSKISELTRSVQLHEKVRARELKEKNDKYKKAVDEMKRLEKGHKELIQKLKDKERALESTNIYTQKIRRNSKDGSEALFGENDPVPPVIKRQQHEREETHPGKKAFITDKDTNTSDVSRGNMPEMDFDQSSRSNKFDSPRSQNDYPHSKNDSPRQHKPVQTLVNTPNKHEENDEEFYGTNEEPATEEQKQLDEIDRRLAEMKKRDEIEKRLEEQRHRDSEAELTEKMKLIDEQRKAKEVEQQKLQEERRIRKEREAEEDRERAVRYEALNNQEASEKQRKKELLLAKMKAIDQGENPSKVTEADVAHTRQNEEKLNRPKKKPIFLQSTPEPTKNNNDGDSILTHEELDFSAQGKDNNNGTRRRGTDDSINRNNSSRKNSWEFKSTDENLHKGLPAHINDSPSSRRRLSKDRGVSDGKNRRQQPDDTLFSDDKRNFSSDKKGRRANAFDNDIEASYSPTTMNNSPRSQNNKPKSNKQRSLFDQFDDPFKKDEQETKPKKGVTLLSDGDDSDNDLNLNGGYNPSSNKNTPRGGASNNNNLSKNNGNTAAQSRFTTKTPSDFGDDDLEEISI